MKLKSYIEVYLEKPDDFTLSLVELESDATVWKAKLRESESGVVPWPLAWFSCWKGSALKHSLIPAVEVARFGDEGVRGEEESSGRSRSGHCSNLQNPS